MSKLHHTFAIQTLVLLVFIALITLLPSLHFMPKVVVWFIDGQRLLELLLLSLILLDATLKKTNRATVKPFNYALFGLLGLTIISACLAQSPRHAFLELTTFIGLCYFALFVVRQYVENPQVFLKRLSYALWVSILLLIVSFYVGYITAIIFKTPLQWPLPFKGFTNIRHFNQYQMWGLGLLCLPLLDNELKLGFELKKNIRFWLHITLIFWWVLLFYSASRGVLLAWALGVLSTALVYRKLAWPLLRLQFMYLAAGYIIHFLLFQIIPILRGATLVTGTILRDSTSDRIGLWNIALDLIEQQPIFGVGPMHYAWHSPTSAHPHNSLLQLAAEWGLPATAIIFSLVSYGVFCWLKRFNANTLNAESKTAEAILNSKLPIVLFFTLIANTAYSLVDGVIVMPISQVMMFMVIGLMIGHYTHGALATHANKSVLRQIIAGLCLIAILWSSLPEIMQGLSGNEKGFSIGYYAQGPRFWRESK
jgi:putative inorganic carbon (hco3(-)) transporter